MEKISESPLPPSCWHPIKKVVRSLLMLWRGYSSLKEANLFYRLLASGFLGLNSETHVPEFSLFPPYPSIPHLPQSSLRNMALFSSFIDFNTTLGAIFLGGTASALWVFSMRTVWHILQTYSTIVSLEFWQYKHSSSINTLYPVEIRCYWKWW